MNIRQTASSILQSLQERTPSPQVRELKNELESLVRAVLSNQQDHDHLCEQMKDLTIEMKNMNRDAHEWGERYKNVIDQYVLVARQRQHLTRRLSDLADRL